MTFPDPLSLKRGLLRLGIAVGYSFCMSTTVFLLFGGIFALDMMLNNYKLTSWSLTSSFLSWFLLRFGISAVLTITAVFLSAMAHSTLFRARGVETRPTPLTHARTAVRDWAWELIALQGFCGILLVAVATSDLYQLFLLLLWVSFFSMNVITYGTFAFYPPQLPDDEIPSSKLPLEPLLTLLLLIPMVLLFFGLATLEAVFFGVFFLIETLVACFLLLFIIHLIPLFYADNARLTYYNLLQEGSKTEQVQEQEAVIDPMETSG